MFHARSMNEKDLLIENHACPQDADAPHVSRYRKRRQRADKSASCGVKTVSRIGRDRRREERNPLDDADWPANAVKLHMPRRGKGSRLRRTDLPYSMHAPKS